MKKEIKLSNIEIITTIVYIGSLILSILLTINDKKKIKNDIPLFDDKLSKKLSIFNRTLVLILTLSFLYVSYENLKIAKEKGINETSNKLQLDASILSTIATIIVLYVVLKSSGEDYSIISGIENPNL